MQGETLATYKIDDLPNNGCALKELLNRMCDSVRASWSGPKIAMAWDTDSEIPHFKDSRGYPMLLIELPASMQMDLPNLAGSAFKLTTLKHLTWAPARSGLVLEGEYNEIELIASDLLPLLRLSNQGCILVTFVCANEVTVVEYSFYRQEYLDVSFQLFLESDDTLEFGTPLPTTSRQCHGIRDGRDYWQPALQNVDSHERIYL